MNAPDLHPVDELIQNLSKDRASAEVTAKLSEHFGAFRDRLAQRDGPASIQARRAVWMRWSWRLATSAVAACLIVAALVSLSRPNVSLAQAAAATMQQPWIHITGKVTNGFQREIWYSMPQGIAAARTTSGQPVKERIDFHDFANKTNFTYVAPENVIYKTPSSDPAQDGKKELDLLERMQEQLLAGKPLAELDLFSKDGGPKILEQKSENVTENGHEWIDVHVQAKVPDEKDPVKAVVRLDRQAKLFHSVHFDGTDRGNPVSADMQFEYPKQGPANIYALGVPKSAKLIDSAPANLQQIADQQRADVKRMDAYRAVVVQEMTDDKGNEIQWFNPPEMLIEHKGTSYRSSHWSGSFRDGKWANTFGQYQTPYKSGDNPRTWWLARIHDLTFQPSDILRDGTDYYCEAKTELDANGAPTTTITRVEDTTNWSGIPRFYARMPEFACRPPMGIGAEGFEPSLNTKPKEGPAGCVLLKLHRLVAEQDPNQKAGVKMGDMLYWLDPAKNHIVVRWDTLAVDTDGKEFVTDSNRVEETAKSPSGVWYATKVHETADWVIKGQETKIDTGYNIYVDFDAKLSDELFAAPTVGMKTPAGL